jgi:hypothetical protein
VLSVWQGSLAREKAAIAALQRVPKELRTGLKEEGREYVPMLQDAARRRTSDKLLQRVIGTGRYSEYRGTPGVRFGGARRITSTGVQARVLARALEFGSDGRRYAQYPQQRGSREVWVLRRTSRQFMPDTDYVGRAIQPAAEAIGPEVVDRWVGVVEGVVIDALSAGG